jgi:hypothetical protein
MFGREARATSTLPNSPKKGSSARLRREAQIELRSLTWLSSPRNRTPPDPQTPTRVLTLSHFSSLLLSLPHNTSRRPTASATAHRRRGATRRRRGPRRPPPQRSPPAEAPQSSPPAEAPQSSPPAEALQSNATPRAAAEVAKSRCATARR